MHAQPGIFAVGTTEHCYLELDLDVGHAPVELVTALAGLCGPASPVGVGVVVALRPELWSAIAPGEGPSDARSFTEIRGPQVTMPSTQHDAWVWIAGGSRDAVFDATLAVLARLGGIAIAASEITGWVYRHDRDLTGFIDGTENPSTLVAPPVAIIDAGAAAGSGVVLVQRWRHAATWEALPVDAQERVIGRTKLDSVELDESAMPADSHVARNVITEDGTELKIFRRNTAYGGPTEHGTLFVGFCRELRILELMLRSMAGVDDGVRDALTRYAEALTGGSYVAPSLESLARFVAEPDEASARG